MVTEAWDHSRLTSKSIKPMIMNGVEYMAALEWLPLMNGMYAVGSWSGPRG